LKIPNPGCAKPTAEKFPVLRRAYSGAHSRTENFSAGPSLRTKFEMEFFNFTRIKLHAVTFERY